MENLFVPYEQSLALKELGFNEPCFAIHSFVDGELNFMYVNTFHSNDDVNELSTAAPIFAQAFRWFREKYNLNGLVEGGYDNGKNIFTYVIWDGFKDNMVDEYFETYEEAELTCLNELIKLAKTK